THLLSTDAYSSPRSVLVRPKRPQFAGWTGPLAILATLNRPCRGARKRARALEERKEALAEDGQIVGKSGAHPNTSPLARWPRYHWRPASAARSAIDSARPITFVKSVSSWETSLSQLALLILSRSRI